MEGRRHVKPKFSLLAVSVGVSGIAVGALGACGSDEPAVTDRVLEGGTDAMGTGGRRFADDSGNNPPPTGTSAIGAPCVADGDCPGDLICLAQRGDDFLGGGPVGGMCTLPCAENGQPDCTAVDSNSRCVVMDEQAQIAYCFQGCRLGAGPLGATKCGDRPDMTCFESESTPGAGFCQPVCAGDFECGDRVCDFGLGVCVDDVDREDLLPIGAECDSDADERTCNGICLGFNDDYSVCSGFCNLGEPGCGSDINSDDPFDGFCVYSVSNPTVTDLGDAGFCGQLCNCNDDCGHPDALCDPLSENAVRNIGRAGLCVPREFSAMPDSGVGIPCDGTSTPPDAGSTSEEGGATQEEGGVTDASPEAASPAEASTG